MKQSLRQRALDKFYKKHELNGLSILDENDNYIERSFSYSGCDICSPGLGNDVYRINDYDVCHDCLCVDANGYDSDYERELDDANYKLNNPDEE